jgi:hypothetical protein
MPPLRLDDSELDTIMRAAQPIDVDRRGKPSPGELAQCAEIGPGLVFLICREQQRRFFTPPLGTDAAEGRKGGKYARTSSGFAD